MSDATEKEDKVEDAEDRDTLWFAKLDPAERPKAQDTPYGLGTIALDQGEAFVKPQIAVATGRDRHPHYIRTRFRLADAVGAFDVKASESRLETNSIL